jgi:hypothetical protein
MKKFHFITAFLLPIVFSVSAYSTDVTIAGFAFSGDLESARKRFPYTFTIFNEQKEATFSKLINERMKAIQNTAFDYKTAGDLVNLKQSDRSLMAVLVLTGEIVATENYGSYFKTFVNLRGDALIFDYKNQRIIRNYPINVVLFDATKERPDNQRIQGFVENLIRSKDEKGLISQFVYRLENAVPASEGTNTVQVRKGEVLPEALSMMPETLRKNVGAIESMLADTLGSILSAKMGISMLPSSIGHAEGEVMSMRLENGDDYKLKLEEGDYIFEVRLNKFAKIKTSENNVGTAYVYGAYTTLRFYEPTQDTTFLATDLKNGEVAIVPAGQIESDDFPAYQDAIRGVFLKFTDAIQSKNSQWINTAASAKNIEEQLELTRETLRKCK